MLLRIYTAFDRVAEEAMPCFTAKNDGVAIRAFRQGTKEARQEEYRLYYLGEFDTDRVRISALEKAEEVLIPEEGK